MKPNRIYRIQLIVFCLLAWDILSVINLKAQEETETPDVVQYESIFADDNCNPPCWFGLLPGESTSQDAAEFLMTSEHIANVAARDNKQWLYPTESGIPIIDNGFYNFDFVPTQIQQCCGFYSRINVRNGTIYNISINILQLITFSEAIERLGIPDEIRMGRYETVSQSSPHSRYFFSFIYFDIRLRVGFAPIDELQHPLICNNTELAEDLRVSGISYYSPTAASEVIDFDFTSPQPALLAYIPEERHVPAEMRSVLMGNETITCQEFWTLLPEERYIPELWNQGTNENG